MQISLTSPAGRTVELFDREGGSGDNLTNTVFDDEAQTSISGAGAPFTGSFKPSPGALSEFDGTPAAGTWTLTVTDVADPDAGQVQSVALGARFCAGAAPTPTPTPTAVPTATPTATPAPPLRPFVGLVKANASVKVKKGVFTIPVRGCAGCAGRVTVTSAKKLRVKGKRKKVKLGTAAFKIGPNGTVTVKVKLSKANQALLKKVKKIPATVALSVTNAAGQRATGRGKLTLKR
jgi:hypothetical protein